MVPCIYLAARMGKTKRIVTRNPNRIRLFAGRMEGVS